MIKSRFLTTNVHISVGEIENFIYRCMFFLMNLLLRSTRRSSVDHKRVNRNRFYTLTSAFSISHDNIDTVEGKVFEYIVSVNSICHTLMILPNTSTDKLTSSFF